MDQYDQTYTSCHIVQRDVVFDSLQWHKDPLNPDIKLLTDPSTPVESAVDASARTWTDVIAG